jgi:hypothetical protein
MLSGITMKKGMERRGRGRKREKREISDGWREVINWLIEETLCWLIN